MARRSSSAAPVVRAVFHLTVVVLVAACAGDAGGSAAGTDSTAATTAQTAGVAPGDRSTCDADNAGLTLPDGFCAGVFADVDGAARHVVVRPDGVVYVTLAGRRGAGGGILALRDTTGDGRADVNERFGPDEGGTGIALDGEQLYFATNSTVMRYHIPAGALLPDGPPDTIVSGLPSDRSHAAKTIALSGDGRIFVNIGAPTNSCQPEDRKAGVPGIDPCPQLETRAGIWVFDTGRTGQVQGNGQRFATGIRNAVALDVNPADGALYAAQHGRDQLSDNWPELYNTKQSAEKPAEEFFKVDQGDDFGWPYCFYDPELKQKILNPEYGGDGHTVGRCADKEDPLVAFPGHWAPDDLIFYTGAMFPGKYRNGAFIAFHGSWNRAPEPQAGYNVSFVPFENGTAAGTYEVFADGFAGGDTNDAAHRPTGLAVGPDGALFVTDDEAGRIYRIIYAGTPEP